MSTVDVSGLSGMFPSLGMDVIMQVLRNTNNNLERAVDVLLAMSSGDDGSSPITPSHPPRPSDNGYQWQTVGRTLHTTSASREQSWPRLQASMAAATTTATTSNSTWSSTLWQGTGTSNAGRFTTSGPPQKHYQKMTPSDPPKWVQQQPFYAAWAMPQPNLSNSYPSGARVDRGWPLLQQPSGPGGPSRPIQQKPMRSLQSRQTSNGVSVPMNSTFGTVKILILLRGLPGSGKSTLARQLVGSTGTICSTDDFFIVNGRYIFDPTKLGENHQKNQDQARRAMEAGMTPVIIDNTNTAAWEMKPYVLMAKKFGYTAQIAEPSTEWKFSVPELERRNSHGVTRDIIMKMLSRYEHNVTIQQIVSSPDPPQNNNRANAMQAPHEQYRYRNSHEYNDKPNYHGHSRNRFETVSSEPSSHHHTDSRHLGHQHRTGLNNSLAKPPPQQVIHGALPRPHPTIATSSHSSDGLSSHSHGSSSSQSSDPSDLPLLPSYTLWSSPPLPTHGGNQSSAAVLGKAPFQLDNSSQGSASPCTNSPPFVNSASKSSTESSTGHNTQLNRLSNKDSSTLLKIIKNPNNMPKLPETTPTTQPNNSSAATTAPSTEDRKVGADFGSDLERELGLTDSSSLDCPSILSDTTSITDHHRLVAQESEQHHSSTGKDRPYVENEEKYATTGIKEYDGFGIGSGTSQLSIQIPPSAKGSGLGDEELASQQLGRERRDSVSTIENEFLELSDPPSTPLGSLTSSDVLEPSPHVFEPPAAKLSVPPGLDANQPSVTTGMPLSSSSPIPPQPSNGSDMVSPPQVPLLMPSALGSDTPSPAVPLLSPPQPELSEMQSDEEDDDKDEQERNLKFLSNCFPKLRPAVMKLWYERQGGDIQSVVDIILHMPQDENDENSSYSEEIMSTTSESTGLSVDTSLDDSQEEVSDHVDEALPDQFEANEQQAIDCVDLKNKNLQSEEVVRRLHLTDEQYAQLLQEHLDVEDCHRQQQEALKTKDRKIHQLEPSSEAEVTASKKNEDSHEDANLELRLTLSLANQLQRMFGSVTHLLPFGGEIQCEDLVVLLSERAAQEIYLKWTDTLMARKVEYEVFTEKLVPQLGRKKVSSLDHQPSNGESSFQIVGQENKRKRTNKPEQEQPLLAPSWNKHKHHTHKKKRAWRPLQPISQEEVDQLVKKEAERHPYTRGVLKELYERFPSIDKPVIHWHFYAHGFKYEGTVEDLLPLVPSVESTDGNHPSRQAGYSQPHFNPSQHSSPHSYTNQVPPAFRLASNHGNANQEEEMLYAELRAEAAVHAQLRNEAFHKASAAYAKKQGELAGYYASQGHRHTEEMREANRRAAEITFKLRNRERPYNTLDLHMLHVDEALTALHEKLESCPVGSQLYVITGRGSHSKGAAKLKPAVEKYLKDMKKRYIEKNPGMLEVNI